MGNYLLVGIGAGLGGMARYGISKITAKNLQGSFPYGTLAVNLIGSLIIGFVVFYLFEKKIISPTTKLLMTTGFCGGLTTFSTFSLETVNMMINSQWKLAGLYIFLNLALSLMAVLIALYLAKVV